MQQIVTSLYGVQNDNNDTNEPSVCEYTGLLQFSGLLTSSSTERWICENCGCCFTLKISGIDFDVDFEENWTTRL